MAGNWRTIRAEILARITSGVWAPGTALPGEVALALGFGVARATVNRAMRDLAEEGIIERRRRAGSRVRPAPVRQARFDIPLVRRDIEDRGAAYAYRLLLSAVGPAPSEVRDRLGLPEGAAMRHVLCLHLADGRPWQAEDRWISLSLLPEAAAADFSAAGPNEWLVARVPYSGVEISILAAPAEAHIAGPLACAPGTALLVVERATRWDGQPVTFVRLWHAPGHRMTTRY